MNIKHNSIKIPLNKDLINKIELNKSLIINDNISYIYLKQTLLFLNNIKYNSQQILFLGTDGYTGQISQLTAYKSNQAYINWKWIPGLFSNWSTVYKSISKYRSAENVFRNRLQELKNLYSKNPDFEVELKEASINKLYSDYIELKKLYQGLSKLYHRPSLLIVLNTETNIAAIREAQKCAIPVIALIDFNNPIKNIITYPIPYNLESIEGLALISNYIADSLINNK